MYIFDIDGTLADSEHRLHHIIGDKKDWDAYDAELPSDTPITSIVEIASTLYIAGFPIVLLTGRNERTREETEIWLHKHRIYYDELLMRDLDDRREDTIIKMEKLKKLLNEFPTEEVQTIFEDRSRLVKAFREEGYHVCQVAEGDF